MKPELLDGLVNLLEEYCSQLDEETETETLLVPARGGELWRVEISRIGDRPTESAKRSTERGDP